MSTAERDPEAIFDAARRFATAEERAAYLDGACGGDAALRDRIEALLRAQADMRTFLEVAPDDSTALAARAVSERPGSIIGRYKLLERIGEGGFGVVFMAEQQAPVRRKVALKIIKLGMDTHQVIARFEAERQALAMMDHPNIARVLDAGATDSGRPYFVMELVKGVPITQYCDANHLSPRQRLDLFKDVCHAVQHAHQKGIIHRDLKPTNVLVSRHDDKPVVKIIDFGIAKATGGRLTEKTLFTEMQQMVGTPAYMSPEQAGFSDLDVDTRSDIYSLGVLLYELLTGTTPFDVRTLLNAGYAEIQRIIREVEPPKPSTRVSSLASTPSPSEGEGRGEGADHHRRSEPRPSASAQSMARPSETGDRLPPLPAAAGRGSDRLSAADIARNRGTDPKTLARTIRGELDWIVMKCLEKDRTRRYDTATELARDVDRHRTSQPVLASPPSTTYRLRKFVRRNRAPVGAGLTLALFLIAGTTGTTLGFLNARREKRIARRSEADARAAEADAKAARDLAIQQKEQLRGATYARTIREAQDLLQRLETFKVRAALDECDEDLRGWEWDYLNYTSDDSISSWRAHDGEVRALALSTDGRWIASGGADGRVKLWDRATGRNLATLPGHAAAVSTVSFSPDAERVFSAGEDGTLRVWDSSDGTLIRLLTGHTGAVLCLTISSDGRFGISGGADRAVILWDMQSFEPIRTFEGHASAIESVAISPDGSALVATAGTVLKVWDANTYDQTLSHEFGGSGRVSVAFDRNYSKQRGNIWAAFEDGRLERFYLPSNETSRYGVTNGKGRPLLAYASAANAVIARVRDSVLVNIETRQWTHLRSHLSSICSVAAEPRGRWLTVGGQDGTIAIFDLENTHEPTWLANAGSVIYARGVAPASSVAFSRDSQRIVTSHVDRLRVFDATAAALLREVSCAHRPTAAAFKGNDIVSGDDTGSIAVRSAETLELRREWKAHAEGVSCLAVSGNGRWIASGCTDGSAVLWDGDGQLITAISNAAGVAVTSLAFTSDAQRVLAARRDGSIILAERSTGGTSGVATIGPSGMTAMCLSPDDQHVATCHSDGAVRLWSAQDFEGGPAAVVRVPLNSVITFSADSKRLICGGPDGSVRVIDAHSGLPLLITPINQAVGDNYDVGISALAASPDGTQFATAIGGGTTILWETRLPPASARQARTTFRAAEERASLLISEPLLRDEILEALRGAPDLTPAVRDAALRVAERIEDDPNRLGEVAWRMAWSPESTANDFRRALEMAETACQGTPHRKFSLAKAICQYRLGQYEDSLNTITELNAALASEPTPWHPERVGWHAMALARVNRLGEARSVFAEFKERVERGECDSGLCDALLVEAEALVFGGN